VRGEASAKGAWRKRFARRIPERLSAEMHFQEENVRVTRSLFAVGWPGHSLLSRRGQRSTSQRRASPPERTLFEVVFLNPIYGEGILLGESPHFESGMESSFALNSTKTTGRMPHSAGLPFDPHSKAFRGTCVEGRLKESHVGSTLGLSLSLSGSDEVPYCRQRNKATQDLFRKQSC